MKKRLLAMVSAMVMASSVGFSVIKEEFNMQINAEGINLENNDELTELQEKSTWFFKLNGYSRNEEFLLDEENREVTFSVTRVDYSGGSVELVDADTDEVIATMLGDGDFENSGDDLDNDCTWCTKLNFENMGAGEYSYYARITDENGDVYKTQTLSVVVFDVTTADILKDSEANQRISNLQDSEAFKSASLNERKSMAEELLNDLVIEGYIKEGSIDYLDEGLFTWIFAATGIHGYFEFTHEFSHEEDEETKIKGDVNADGIFSVADVILLQKWLLSVPDTHLTNWKAADFCEDGKLDVFDLCLMKRALIETNTSGSKKLTRDDIIALAKKGDSLTWADFAKYQGENIGSGLFVVKYEIADNDECYVLVCGEEMNGKPDNILLESIYGASIDIRSKEFQEINRWL